MWSFTHKPPRIKGVPSIKLQFPSCVRAELVENLLRNLLLTKMKTGKGDREFILRLCNYNPHFEFGIARYVTSLHGLMTPLGRRKTVVTAVVWDRGRQRE